MTLAESQKEANHCEYRIGALRIATSLETHTDADRLTVHLNGYCGRGADQPPVFARWPPPSHAFGHILRVSDPTLFLTDWMKGSSFLGTECDDPIPAIVKISNEVAAALGVTSKRVLFVGHSGGGFGALQCAILDQEALGIGINALSELQAYAPYAFATRSIQSFREGATLSGLCAEFPSRFSLVQAIAEARKAGRRPRLALIQNILDESHFFAHYGALCQALNTPLLGGAEPSGRCRSVLFEKAGGHSVWPEPPVFKQVIAAMTAGN